MGQIKWCCHPILGLHKERRVVLLGDDAGVADVAHRSQCGHSARAASPSLYLAIVL
jgi:hypothetical protein